MAAIGQLLQGIAFLISVVCLILIWVQMFQRGQTGLAIVFIVLSLICCGVLMTYIYGWFKSGEWGMRNIMLLWTAAIILGMIGGAINPFDRAHLDLIPLP